MEEQKVTVSIQVGSKLDFAEAGGVVAVTLLQENGESLAAYLNVEEAIALADQIASAAHGLISDLSLYAYFLALIVSNQPSMPEESRKQLAAKQVANIRQFRASIARATEAGIPSDTALKA